MQILHTNDKQSVGWTFIAFKYHNCIFIVVNMLNLTKSGGEISKGGKSEKNDQKRG